MKKNAPLSLLLAALLLTGAACGSEDTQDTAPHTGDTVTDTDSDAAETESETLYADHLPDDLDFGGATVRIHARGDEDSLMEVAVVELNGDALNDAIYNRNARVSERLNVILERVDGPGWENYAAELNRIKASIIAGDNSYQCIAAWNAYVTLLALDNCFRDLTPLPYLETDMPWWNQTSVNSMALGGKLLFLTGDISFLTSFGGAYVLFTNDRLAKDHGIPSIPAMVRNGSWTLDNMLAITKNIYSDVDGNGVMDEKDSYGYVTDFYNAVDSWYTASDIHQITLENGEPVYTPQLERVTALIEKISPMFYNGSLVGTYYTDAETQMDMFKNGQALIILRELDNARSYFRDMEDSYTINPLPKYDEAQNGYYSNTYTGATMWCIPTDNPEPEIAAAVMEALAADSYTNVMPAYFETCLQGKLSRNEDTIDMLQVIREGAVADIEYLYSFIFGTPHYVMRDVLSDKNGSANVASWYAKNNERIRAQIDSTIQTIQNMQ